MTTKRLHLGVECLEGRDCPAVTLFNGILTLTGTSGADTLVVNQSGNTIFAGGVPFNAAQVGRIVITGFGGDDVIRNNAAKPSTLYGGMGNDTVAGGNVNDVVFGGHGNDTLKGRVGTDKLVGGAGTDTLVDLVGGDTLIQGSPAPTRANKAIELQIITLVNEQRALAGLPALTINPQLNVAASMHTANMVRIGNAYGSDAGHTHVLYGTARPHVTDRLDSAGYDNWTNGFGYGENIAFGFTTAQAAMTAWMNSAGHRGNILHTGFKEIGVSVIADAGGRFYFTQVFGYRL